VEPIGYPVTAVVCGRAGCVEPAVIWLDEVDSGEYEKGVRIFPFANVGMKVRVAEEP
jgi:hypothetical protein